MATETLDPPTEQEDAAAALELAPEGESEVTSQPGDQGVATQDDPPETTDSDGRFHRNPSKEEFARAKALYDELHSDAHDMHPERVIDILLQIVDVHELLTMPPHWPKGCDQIMAAPSIDKIAKLLARGCRAHINLGPGYFNTVWLNQQSWTEAGEDVVAKVERKGKVDRFLLGLRATLKVDYRSFQKLNPRRKLFYIYRALREVDAEGKRLTAPIRLFYDQLRLFGTGTDQSMVMLQKTIEEASGRKLMWDQQHDMFGASEGETEEATTA